LFHSTLCPLGELDFVFPRFSELCDCLFFSSLSLFILVLPLCSFVSLDSVSLCLSQLCLNYSWPRLCLSLRVCF
jgi:hypothetical protein